MIEGRCELRLVTKTLLPLGVGRQSGRQHLDRDVAIEARVVGAVDRAHAAAADDALDSVVSELLSGCQFHPERRFVAVWSGDLTVIQILIARAGNR